MTRGTLLAAVIGAATLSLIVIGTVWPVPSAVAFAGGESLLRTSSTPRAAVEILGDKLRLHAWADAYASLGNKAEFTQQDFIRDLSGSYTSLRTYATLDSFEVLDQHASANEAQLRLRLHWSTVVGPFISVRDLRVVRDGDRWSVDWPLFREPRVPPQVVTVNYLRWDVIYPGAGDPWGVQDVEAPHIRIVDMHPVQRASGVVILGELLNEDVVPASVSVKATLLAKNGSPIATEDSFDKIAHTLLPKQVTPFLINFPDASLADVGSINMQPLSTLVSASADPVIAIDNQRLNPAPDASLSAQLVNQSGQVVNIAHVLATFYDKSGQVVWVADQYIDRALLPQTPVAFDMHIPEDLARRISSERTIATTYSFGGFS
jgi:hypothetical protein